MSRIGLPLLAGVLVFASSGLALAAAGGPAKVLICHATNSNHHPYVVNQPFASADVGGHAGHTGQLWDPTLKALGTAWGDIIPPFDYDDHGVTGHFLGYNWTTPGQAIYNNGCALPPPALSITVAKTNNANGDSSFTGDETTLIPGATVPFQVAVTNTSSVPVIVDSVTDAVGLSNVPMTCSPALVGTSIAPAATAVCAFSVASYSPVAGQSKTNTATVQVHEGYVLDPADEDRSNITTGSASSIVRTGVPALSLGVVKTNDADGDTVFHTTETAASAGQTVPYHVVVTNNSTVPVDLDGLTDVVGSAAAVPVSCTSALPTSLAPGASAACDFVLASSSPAAGGSLVDTVTAAAHQSGNASNTTTGSGSSTVLTAAPAGGSAPDLGIVKTGPTHDLHPGDSASYLLTVSNNGSAPASSVVVDDALPAGTTLSSITATGWTCTGAAVHCVYDTALTNGSSASITVVLTLDNPFAAASLSNTGRVSPTDGTPADNSSTVANTVLHSADLRIVKTGPAQVAAGGVISWTLTVTNDGDAPASTVTVTDHLPSGVHLSDLSATGWTCSGTSTVTCALDTPLAAGASAVVAIGAKVSPGATGTLSNTAVVDPSDATPTDNSSTAITTVVPVTNGGGGTTTGTGGTPTGAGGGTPFTGGGGGTTVTSGGGKLAFTGAPVSQWATEAAVMIGLGLLFLLLGRRREGTR